MLELDLALDGPLDLPLTLRPLVRGQGDRTIRLARGRACWTTRTADGPATLLFRHEGGRLHAEAHGPGADRALERAARVVGVDPGSTGVRDLAGVADRRIYRLARRFVGVRLCRTEAVFDALLPAILEQKVTGTEARRAWHGLVRDHGEPAPGPPDLVAGLRLAPAPAVLAALPYYAYHRYGLEQRRAELIRRVAARAAWLAGGDRGSAQMMLNMIEPGLDRSATTQLKLQKLARSWSGSRPDGLERQGASVRGWAAGLNILDAGPYKLVGEATLEGALRTAARAIAATGKPVGLLVWRGRHAWVMSGFSATANPASDAFTVTRANIHDPLYPHGSAVWGPSPAPGEALTPAEVGRQFVPRRMRAWPSAIPGMIPSTLGGKYVLVLPYKPDLTARAATTR